MYLFCVCKCPYYAFTYICRYTYYTLDMYVGVHSYAYRSEEKQEIKLHLVCIYTFYFHVCDGLCKRSLILCISNTLHKSLYVE